MSEVKILGHGQLRSYEARVNYKFAESYFLNSSGVALLKVDILLFHFDRLPRVRFGGASSR